ncbi:MAG: hypothetical protein ACRDCN_07535, partial [Tannerellaceae bacterium]
NFYFKPPNNFEVFFKVSFQAAFKNSACCLTSSNSARLKTHCIFSIFLSSHSLSIADTKVVLFPFPPNVL